jgi:serine phosphatase RsbU (regulator of sigma subunit)
MARPVSIRRSLLTNLIVLVLGLGAAVLATTWLGARRTLQRVTASLITRSLDQTDAELHRFFDPVSHGLVAARAWGEAGMLRLDDPAALERLLLPVVRAQPQVSAVLLADERGRSWLLRQEGHAWVLRESDPERLGPRMRVLEWSDGDPARRERVEDLDFDPRSRPWYRLAVERRDQPGPHWTDAYAFFTTGEPGMTAATAFQAPGGERLVVGFDVRLRAISEFTGRFEVSRRGIVFVLSDDGRFLGLPREGLFTSEAARAKALLRQPSEVGVPLLSDAAAAARARPGGPDGPLRLRHAGEPWWLGAHRFELGPARGLTIAVLVPENDLLIQAARQRVTIAGLTSVALLLGMLRAIRLARSYSRPIEALVRESDRIRRGDLEPGEAVESPVEEMSRLAQAHDGMRVALRSLLRLERDLQLAREIQQRTFPESMPRIAGYEIDAWSEPADETGGDTYDVIGLARGEGRAPRLSADGAERVLLLLADATGHGIGPALSVTQVRAMLRMAARIGADLPAIARHLNEQLCADLHEGRFVTAWLGELDVGANVLASLAAGQGPLLRYDAAADRFEELAADTVPLGIVPDLGGAEPRAIALAPGDLVAVLSDGIFELCNPAGEAFGMERVQRVIRAHRHQTASQLLAVLRDALHAFAAGRPAADDRTAIVVRRREA